MRHYEDKPYFASCVLGLKKTDGYTEYDLVRS